ncbi:MAG: DUF1385 domain-containing protein [Clostridia bacterium]|nr:DUF1385 domain-containing protein [Clostridia bacterium]
MSKKEKIENEKFCSVRKTSIGGQALLEGIMMRGPKKTALVVRNMQEEMVTEEWETPGNNRAKFFKLPFVRGIFNFFDSLKTGYKALMRSAEISTLDAMTKKEDEPEEKTETEEKSPVPEDVQVSESEQAEEETPAAEEVETVEEAPEQEVPAPETEEKKDKNARRKVEVSEDEKLSKGQITAAMVIGVVLGLVLAIGLFIVVPTFAAKGILYLAGAQEGEVSTQIWKSVIEGVIKIILLVGYVAAVALMKDIRRTYMYHGAEHKTIFCYEAGLDLTVENVRKMRRFHPRCGTSFMILMVLVSIFIGFFVPSTYIETAPGVVNTLIRALIKLALIPLTVGIGYELLKFAGRHDNILTKIISAPGVALQHLTVYEPTDDMIEVAIHSLKQVIPEDGSDQIVKKKKS